MIWNQMLWRTGWDFPFCRAWEVWTLLKLKRSLVALHLSTSFQIRISSLSAIIPLFGSVFFSLLYVPILGFLHFEWVLSLVCCPAPSFGDVDALHSVNIQTSSRGASLTSPSSISVFFVAEILEHFTWTSLSSLAFSPRVQSSFDKFLSTFLLHPYFQREATLNFRESVRWEWVSHLSCFAPSLWHITPKPLGEFMVNSWKMGAGLIFGWISP